MTVRQLTGVQTISNVQNYFHLEEYGTPTCRARILCKHFWTIVNYLMQSVVNSEENRTYSEKNHP